MKSVKIIPKVLQGEIRVPPSKSISHRAIICAGLCEGTSTIDNVLFSQDIIATCKAMEALGVEVSHREETLNYGTGTIFIKGNPKLRVIQPEINCNESGSTLRFLIPLGALTGEEIAFIGAGKLVQRPLNPYYDIFEKQNIAYSHNNGGLPLTLQGKLQSGIFEIKGNISSQFITGLLFALPLLDGDSKIRITTELESKGYVDLTIDILKQFSIEVENKGYKEFYIKGNQKYRARDYQIEGDFSQAAFWIVAKALGGNVKCTNLNVHSLQGDKIILDLVKNMHGDSTIDSSQYPDLVPILAVRAALSKGTTKIVNAGRLRIKESDRLRAIATELNTLGGQVEELSDGLIIQGQERLTGGQVDSWNDHRIAMALAIASIGCSQPVIITNSDAVTKSYPAFWQDFRRLGGEIYERNMG